MQILLKSTPVPMKFGFSFNIVKSMHPDPVPISKILSLDLFLVNFKTSSMIISVSGLGIKTFSVILNSYFQKSFLPNK